MFNKRHNIKKDQFNDGFEEKYWINPNSLCVWVVCAYSCVQALCWVFTSLLQFAEDDIDTVETGSIIFLWSFIWFY